MLVIVEGIDRVGKTTLCEKLRDTGYLLFKDAYAKPDITMPIAVEKTQTTLQFLEMLDGNTNVVIDRLHLTEYVYGYCDRGYDNQYMDLVDAKLSLMNTKLILVVPDSPTDLERASERHGKSLWAHDQLFKQRYHQSRIKKKVMTTFNGQCGINSAFWWLPLQMM